MADLIDTTEMYLRTVLELEEEGIVPLRARISERLGHSGPTVSQTVGRMDRDGLIRVGEDRRLVLTDTGRRKAIEVMRKHRLAERLLSDVIGLDWAYVHEEACRWEHVMSERVERKLLGILDHPVESPYGNPIPGLDELGLTRAGSFHSGVESLSELLVDSESEATGRIKRLAEPLQVDPALLRQFSAAGIAPGATASFIRRGAIVHIEVEGSGEALDVPIEIAAHIFVAS